MTTSPTPNRVIYAGGKSAENAITTTDVFNTDIIGIAKRKAQMSNPVIRPVNVDGGNYYVMVVDPYQARDLKKDENGSMLRKTLISAVKTIRFSAGH